MNIFTKFFLIIFVSLIGISSLFPQGESGVIYGTVTDSISGEFLSGANVWLKGYSLGAASDFEGKYTIPKVSPGSYILTIRYIGYRTKEMSVKVTSGANIELNVALLIEAIEGEVITITGQAQGQREAINNQLSSNTITNIVSEEKIHELPDFNAATALSRLPGLSLMNGDQVVIRGMHARNNLVLVNGIQLPSTDENTRATNLGFISSNMLSSIEVIKVLTPDMDANAIGGVVNLRLREAPSNFHFDMLVQGSLNQQDMTWGNYRFWASASQRFFNDKLGVFLQGNADRSEVGNDQTTAGFGRNGNQTFGEAPYRMDNFTFNDQQNLVSSYGGSLLLDYKLPHGKILLQNTISKGVNDNASHNTQYDFGGSRIIYALNRDKYDRMLIANALQTEYNFGNLKGELTLSYSYSNRNTDIRYADPGDNTNFANPAPDTVFGQSYTSIRDTLTHDEALAIQINPEDYKGARLADWAVIREVAFNQHIYNSQLDFSLPLSFSSDFSSIFKVGGKFIRTTRQNDLNRWYRRVGDENFWDGVTDFIPGKTLSNASRLLFTDIQNTDYNRGKYFLNETHPFNYAFNIDMMDDFYTSARAGWPNAGVHQAGSVQNDFNGVEIFSAAYVMGTFSIGPQITFIAGGRYEFYNMDYDATNFLVSHAVDGNGRLIDTLNTVDRNDENIFPNAQLRYKFTDWGDIRLAFSQSISRPDYQAILPNIFFNPGTDVLSQAGNPELKPAVSTNYDVYLSFYNNEIGLFTVGGFYKEIDDPFFSTEIYFKNISYYDISFPDSAFWLAQNTNPPLPNQRIQTWINNPTPAYLKGLEFEWQTNFWYLPRPFNSLVFSINYTRVWSKMDYHQVNNETRNVRDPVTGRFRPEYFTTDTIRTGRLLNQGNDILNVALGVDYKGFSGRISFNLQGNVITTVGVRPEEDQFTGNIYKWDFTLKQELPFKGLSIQLSGINIFHTATENFRKFRRVPDGPIIENLSQVQYSPRVFELNLRYTL
ncbi:MAG: TonB-dependent receptor domain-containing protein [Ignavibacteria bacterium]